MKYSFHLVLLLLVVFFGGLAYFVVAHFTGRSAVSGTDAEIPVRIVQARRIMLQREIKLSGELLPVKRAQVVSRLAGKVTEVRFRPGDFVRAGTIVATIRARDLEQRLAGMESGVGAGRANLRSRQDELAETEKRLAHARELFLRDLIPRRDVEQSETGVQTARAESELARAQLAQREAMLAQLRALQKLTELRAPISGAVGAVWVAPGAAVVEGGPVMSLLELDRLKLIASISGALPHLQPNAQAQISNTSFPGKILEGKIIRAAVKKSSETEPITELELHVNNFQRDFRPHMSVEVSIPSGKLDVAHLVPRSAVLSQGPVSYVYKYVDGRAVRQEIVIGAERGQETAIVQGLREGEWVFETYPSELAPGARIEPLIIDKSGDAAK